MGIEKKIDESDIRILVGKNLKRLRALQNISQLDLALTANLTNNFINDIENYKKSISYKTLAKLAATLNVEPYQFYLPESMVDEKMWAYVNDFNDQLQKMVSDLTRHYTPKPVSPYKGLLSSNKKGKGK
jgi:transcriptional regulator with XRE-family HTH domain